VSLAVKADQVVGSDCVLNRVHVSRRLQNLHLGLPVEIALLQRHWLVVAVAVSMVVRLLNVWLRLIQFLVVEI
jgi:hypothetical protein